MLTLLISAAIAAAPLAAAPAPPPSALALAERALRAEANTLVAERRSAVINNDRTRAQCYNGAIYRVQVTLDNAQTTLARTRALHRVQGSAAKHRQLDAHALRDVRTALSVVRTEKKRAQRCIAGRRPGAIRPPQRAHPRIPTNVEAQKSNPSPKNATPPQRNAALPDPSTAPRRRPAVRASK